MRASNLPASDPSRAVLATLAGLLLSSAACTMHSTDSTEVGVLVRKVGLFGKSGIQTEVYAR